MFQNGHRTVRLSRHDRSSVPVKGQTIIIIGVIVLFAGAITVYLAIDMQSDYNVERAAVWDGGEGDNGTVELPDQNYMVFVENGEPEPTDIRVTVSGTDYYESCSSCDEQEDYTQIGVIQGGWSEAQVNVTGPGHIYIISRGTMVGTSMIATALGGLLLIVGLVVGALGSTKMFGERAAEQVLQNAPQVAIPAQAVPAEAPSQGEESVEDT